MREMFVRDLYPTPTNPVERKDLIRWVLNHPLWITPVKRNISEEEDIISEMIGDVEYLPGYGWEQAIEIIPVFVNDNNEIDDDDSKNIHFRIWLEAGQPYDMSKDSSFNFDLNDTNKYLPSHDLDLDCGGSTLDDAFIELAIRVKHFYGDYDQSDHGWIEWHKTNENGLLKD